MYDSIAQNKRATHLASALVPARAPAIALTILAALFVFVLFSPRAEAQDLSIEKKGNPGTVKVGDLVTYTLTVTSDAAATNAVVTDKLPDGMKFIGFRDVDSSNEDCEQDGRNITCTFSSLAANDPESVKVVVQAQKQGSITNKATVVDTESGDNNDTDKATTQVKAKDNNNGDGNNDGNNRQDRRNAIRNLVDQYREDSDLSSAEQDLAEEEGELSTLDNEISTLDNQQYEDTSGNGVSANADENGASAETPGASASANGDEDTLGPVGPQGDVVDEVPTSGPLPDTGGVPVATGTVLALVLFGAGLLVVRLVMIWRERT